MLPPAAPMRRALLLAAVLICTLPLAAQAAPAAKTPVVQGYGGAVASISAPASQAALQILNQGGNAVDAAVAAAAALGVSDPFSCGIGGGGFMLIYLARENRVISIDHRETAPAAFRSTVFMENGKEISREQAISSGNAVGVPGTVRGWHEALERYGTRSFKQVLAPAIELASRGFVIDDNFHHLSVENEAKFSLFASTSALYLKDGKALPAGTLFRNPGMARAYRDIAQHGVKAFYTGPLAQAIVASVQQPPVANGMSVRGGGLTLADLANYEARIRLPLASTYRGYQVVGMNLPSSGGATIAEALNILEGYDLAHLPHTKAEHLYLEASRLAFADRNAYLADPEFVDVPLAGLTCKAYADERRKLIDLNLAATGPAKAGDPYPFQQDPGIPLRPQADAGGAARSGAAMAGASLSAIRRGQPDGSAMAGLTASTPLPPAGLAATAPFALAGMTRLLEESPHTTHLTVADREGNIVAYTFTIESWGGSGIVVPGYGFILNNEMTDFDFSGPHPNVPEPGKRPRSSMAPTLVFKNGKPAFSIGSPGGSTIITTVLQTIFNHIDLGMPLPQALAAPRMSQRNGASTLVEPGFAASEQGRALQQLGHVWGATPTEIGAASALLFEANGKITAISEPQRHGIGSARVQRQKP